MTGIDNQSRPIEPNQPFDVLSMRKSVKDVFDASADDLMSSLPKSCGQSKDSRPLSLRLSIGKSRGSDILPREVLKAFDDLLQSLTSSSIEFDPEQKSNEPVKKFLGQHRGMARESAKSRQSAIQNTVEKRAQETLAPTTNNTPVTLPAEATAAALGGRAVFQKAFEAASKKGKEFLSNVLKPRNESKPETITASSAECRERLALLATVEIPTLLPSELPATEEDLFAADLLIKMIDIPKEPELEQEFAKQGSLCQESILTVYSEHIADADLFNGISLVMHSAEKTPNAKPFLTQQKVKIWDFATKWLNENSAGLLKNKETLRAIYSAVASGLESKDPEVKKAADVFRQLLSEVVHNQKELQHSVPISHKQITHTTAIQQLTQEFDHILTQKIGGSEYKEKCLAWCSDITRAFAEPKSQLTRQELILTPEKVKKETPEKIPNLLALTEKFEIISDQIQNMLLYAADPEQKGSPIKYCAARCFLLDMAMELAKKNDLDGVYVLAVALASPTVTRLDNTILKQLSPDNPTKKQYDKKAEAYQSEIAVLMSTSKNQINMRKKAEASHVAIPYNLFAKDQFVITESNKKKLEDSEYPNPNRASLLTSSVTLFMADIPRAQKIAQQPIQSSLGNYLITAPVPDSDKAQIARIERISEIRENRPSGPKVAAAPQSAPLAQAAPKERPKRPVPPVPPSSPGAPPPVPRRK